MPTNAMIALTGVSQVWFTRPIQRGSRPSRPALKISLHCEFTAAISTPIVEVRPAMNAMNASHATTPCATLMNGIAAPASALSL